MPSSSAGSLRQALQRHPRRFVPALPGRTNHREAGITVPVVLRETISVLLILRASHLRQHAGEVGFPGGKPEPNDPSIAHTALRELHEELGLYDPPVLGRLSSCPLYTSDYRLEPFVVELDDPQALSPDPGEVAEVLWIDLDAVLAQPVLHGMAFLDKTSPVFPIGPHLAYGGTAHVLMELLQIVAAVQGIALPPMNTEYYTWEMIRARAW